MVYAPSLHSGEWGQSSSPVYKMRQMFPREGYEITQEPSCRVKPTTLPIDVDRAVAVMKCCQAVIVKQITQ